MSSQVPTDFPGRIFPGPIQSVCFVDQPQLVGQPHIVKACYRVQRLMDDCHSRVRGPGTAKVYVETSGELRVRRSSNWVASLKEFLHGPASINIGLAYNSSCLHSEGRAQAIKGSLRGYGIEYGLRTNTARFQENHTDYPRNRGLGIFTMRLPVFEG